MKMTDIPTFVADFIAVSNAYDTEKYLEKWNSNAILDDPSVGQIFNGRSAIKRYFESYFIGYKTQTELVNLEIISDTEAHLEVDFKGEFPGGQIGGIFEFTFRDNQIIAAKADLI